MPLMSHVVGVWIRVASLPLAEKIGCVRPASDAAPVLPRSRRLVVDRRNPPIVTAWLLAFDHLDRSLFAVGQFITMMR